MQYELYMMKNIVRLIDEGKLLSDLSSNERMEYTRIVLDKRMDVNELESEIKKVVDYLGLKYGLLEALVRLRKLREDIIRLRTSHNADIQFFSIPLSSLYNQIEKAYSINVYLKVYGLIPRIANETLSNDDLLTLVLKESISAKRALGIEVSDIGIQDSLFGIQEEEIDSLKSIKNSLQLRQNLKRELVTVLRREYSPREISKYCASMVDVLSTSPKEEHKIIASILLQNVVPELLKGTRTNIKVSEGMQLLMKGYKENYKKIRDPQEEWGTKAVYY